MQENIDKYKIVVNRFSAELPESIDRTLRTLVTIEVDCYSVDTPETHDGFMDKIFKCKLVGTTIVKQGTKKPIICKSKRSPSQRLRFALSDINSEEEFYETIINKLIANKEDVVEFLKDK